MKRIDSISIVLLAVAVVSPACTAVAQQSFYQRFRQNNASMAEVQPSWMGPLIQSDGRLGQAFRFSVANFSMPGAHPINYGNNHGFNVIVARRFQLDCDPPSFFRNHSSTLKDGFGNMGTQVKYRIASGNGEHGNFAVSAVLYHAFAPRVYQNEMLSSFYVPSIAAGKGFGRFAVLSTVGGFLPTAKIYAQGRAIEWNLTAQVHASPHVWFDVENNALSYVTGPFDGKTQDFLTPAAFYMVRRKSWGPAHSALVFDAGMQIATTSFHFYNHNLITEMRILF